MRHKILDLGLSCQLNKRLIVRIGGGGLPGRRERALLGQSAENVQKAEDVAPEGAGKFVREGFYKDARPTALAASMTQAGSQKDLARDV